MHSHFSTSRTGPQKISSFFLILWKGSNTPFTLILIKGSIMLTITLISLSHLHIISLKVFPKHFMHKFTFVSLKNVSKPEWILLLCGHYDLLAKRHYRQNISMWKELKEMKVFALSIGHTINLMMLCKLAFWSLRHWFAKTTIMIFEQELRKTQREENNIFSAFQNELNLKQTYSE